MLLRITKPAKGSKLVAELFDGEKLLFADKMDVMNATARAKLIAEVVGRGQQLTNEQVLELRQGGELALNAAATAVAQPAVGPTLRIVRRKKHQPAAAGIVFSNINDALSDGADEDVLEWDDIEQLAILDVDYHNWPLDQRPQPFQLEAMALTVRPLPKMFWVSKGRGMHLLFQPIDGLTAEEAAACGGLTVKQLDPKCTFEVIARTSYPPNGEVWS